MRLCAPLCSIVLCLGGLAGICQAEPVSYKEMIPLLTALQLPGWTAGTPKGQTVKSPFEASEATVEFTSGDKRLEVAIYDGGPQVGAALASIGEMEVESTEVSIKPVAVQGFKGTLNISKTDNDADLLVAAGNRVVVSVHLAGATDAEVLTLAAGQVDLKKLESLAK